MSQFIKHINNQPPVNIYNDPLIKSKLMSSKPTEMEQQLLENLLDQLIEQQLRTYQGQQQLFYYTDILINTCKKIQMICNHSPIAQQQFCCYIINKLLTSSLEMPPNVEHVLLQRLKVEENYVVYFTQICYRLILLGCLCKLGEENKKKQWRLFMDELMKQARIEFTFNYHDSLATTFVTFLNRIDQICNQFTFYEKIIKLFIKSDLEFVAENVKQKMAKAKQNWKLNVNKNKQQFHNAERQTEKKLDHLLTAERLKKARKSVRIVCEAQKLSPNQNLRKRISDFRQIQRKRLSQHKQSSKKRTLFQSRKYIIKTNSSSPSFQEGQSIYIEENQQMGQVLKPNQSDFMKQIREEEQNSKSVCQKQAPKPRLVSNPNNKQMPKCKDVKQTQKKGIKEEQRCGDDEGFFVPGTPPRKKLQNKPFLM